MDRRSGLNNVEREEKSLERRHFKINATTAVQAVSSTIFSLLLLYSSGYPFAVFVTSKPSLVLSVYQFSLNKLSLNPVAAWRIALQVAGGGTAITSVFLACSDPRI
jgi:hypothetical protein